MFTSTESVCEESLTVLQGERGAVHRLALGWSSALRVGHRAGVVNAAPEAGAQLQAPHVANHSRRIKGLLWRQGWKQTNVKPKTDHRRHHTMFILCWFYLIIKRDEVLCAHPPFAFGKVFPYLSADWFMDVLAESGVSSNPEKLKSRPFRSCKSQFTHTNAALPKPFISVCVAITLVPLSCLLRSFIFILPKHLWLMGWSFLQELTHCITFCHIHHNISVWNLVDESHFSTLWYLLPVSRTTYLYQNNHLPRTPKAHYWLTNLFILATSAGDSSPGQLTLVSSGSGLGRHPNCSLNLPHS